MATKSYWHQFQQHRITRRRLLGATGVGAAGLAFVAACGDGGSSGGNKTPGSDDGEPQTGGRYIYSVTGDWGTIDPVTSVAFAPGIFPRIYNVLLDRSRTDPSTFYYDLAESYELVGDDTYIFTLRPGVKIAPNSLGIPERDMDSSDAKAWLDRITQEEAAVARAFTNLWLDSYEATDATHFQIKTKGPYAYFLFRLGPPLGGTIPPKEFFEGGMSLQDQGVGAGPHGVIVSGEYSNTGGMLVQRNVNYYRKDADDRALPFIDEVQAVRISDRQPRRTAFIDKQIHSYAAENKEERDQLLSQVGGSYFTEDPSNTFVSFTMHPEKEPWTDENIRKAANFALNRQEYVDLIVGSDGGQIDGLVHWSVGDFALPPDELAELQPFDPEESKRLIREATGNDRISIKVIYPISDIEFHDKTLPIWRQQMDAAGFDLEEDPQDFTTWLANYQTLNYDASLSLNQVYETAEIPLDFHSKDGPQGDRNYAVGIGALYPEIEQAIQDSKAVADPNDAIEQVREVQRMIYDKGPAFLPFMTWTTYTMYHELVKNVPRDLGATGLYYANEMWLDQAQI